MESILFATNLCNGCHGEVTCQTLCPESAVTVSRVPAEEAQADSVVLISGEMATCKDCEKFFIPERKLATLLAQKKITAKDVQKYCPNCRRIHLLDSYLTATGQV